MRYPMEDFSVDRTHPHNAIKITADGNFTGRVESRCNHFLAVAIQSSRLA